MIKFGNQKSFNIISFLMKMASLPSLLLAIICCLLFLTQQSSPARTLGDPTPSPHHHRHHHHKHHNHHKMTFLMRNVLKAVHPSQNPATTVVANPIPFPKPPGLFPPKGGIPLPQSNPTVPTTGFSTQTLGVSSIGLLFPARATLEELEFGSVTEIEEALYDGRRTHGPLLVGKAQGIYVASSEDGASHMMAMTANFANNEFKDGLRFFGVHKKDTAESHIAVIGGTGKYQGANGYAVVQAVNQGSNVAARQENRTKELLLFSIYLS